MKPGKMDKVAAVAKIAEQKSARELSLQQQGHQQKCDQFEQLVEFREGYELTLSEKASKGMSAKQLQDYRLFLGRLSQAIEQQTRDVHESEKSLAMMRAQWISTSQRHSALDHLVDERHREQVKIREKVEQNESDEHTMNRRLSKND
ncbi:MAG: flagellar FliJ protein [Bacteroidia bacterium]|jgi:flagellar FliJ protein